MPFGQFTATTALTQMIPANTRRSAMLIKSMGTNSTTAFIKLESGAGTATTATLMPIAPGESLYLTANNGAINCSDLPAAVQVISGSGGEDFRWIDF